MLYQFIVYSKKENLMLFDTHNDKISLPYFQSKPFHIADTKPINEYFYNQYHLCINVLKCWTEEDSRLVYEAEVLNGEIPYDSKRIIWLNPFNRKNVYKLPKQGQRILQQWTKNESYLMPWFQYGFRDEIDKWVGRQLTGSFAIEQVRSWEKGLLLKVRADDNNYYVKTVPSIFDHEPFVHKSMPEFVPEVIATDERKNTYMMREINGELLGYSRDIYQWEITALRIAKLQKKYMHGEIQIKKTIPKRPIEQVLTEKQMNKTIRSLQNYISNVSYQALSESIPDVLSLVQSAKSLLSIDHGDLFGGNVIVENGEPFIFDWSNSSMTHPFLSVVHLMEEVADFFSENLSEELLNVYLCEWTDYGQIDKLRDEFSIVRLLEPIYYLGVHILHIFPSFHYNVDKEEIIEAYVTKWLSNKNKISEHV
ncbi:phosphotransferase family protein [Natribacillus halophilus]|uniref:Phosphotransferase enzyme family protein n=1 Tax=Natribacillus halophilus TaxID=549003 RepID=A0A1G8SYB3_9BACI|nr:hypothetical protein [Natribacillus halophilus]SDJ33550.1 hypothetical protein SAMN04488123_1382 [Natribacillus halophilus]